MLNTQLKIQPKYSHFKTPICSVNGKRYRYGFNGMEKDNEISGEENIYTTEFRQYDSRIGRWFSIDPLAKEFSDYSPFAYGFNNPLIYIDIYGDAPTPFNKEELLGYSRKYNIVKTLESKLDWNLWKLTLGENIATQCNPYEISINSSTSIQKGFLSYVFELTNACNLNKLNSVRKRSYKNADNPINKKEYVNQILKFEAESAINLIIACVESGLKIPGGYKDIADLYKQHQEKKIKWDDLVSKAAEIGGKKLTPKYDGSNGEETLEDFYNNQYDDNNQNDDPDKPKEEEKKGEEKMKQIQQKDKCFYPISKFQKSFVLLLILTLSIKVNGQNIDSLVRNDRIDFIITFNSLVCIDDSTGNAISRNLVLIKDSILYKFAVLKGDSLRPYLLTLLNSEDKDWAANVMLYFIYRKEALPLLNFKKNISDWRLKRKKFDVEFWSQNQITICK